MVRYGCVLCCVVFDFDGLDWIGLVSGRWKEEIDPECKKKKETAAKGIGVYKTTDLELLSTYHYARYICMYSRQAGRQVGRKQKKRKRSIIEFQNAGCVRGVSVC